MKSILILIFFSFWEIILAQKNVSTNISLNSSLNDPIIELSIYPGCEKHKKNNNDLMKCFAKNLQKDFLRFLDDGYPKTSEPKKLMTVNLEFISNTNGYIEQIKAIEGDAELKPQAIKAMQDLAFYLKKKNKKIMPAKTMNGKSTPLIYQQSFSIKNPYYETDLAYYLYKKNYTEEEIFRELQKEPNNPISKNDLKKMIKFWKKRK